MSDALLNAHGCRSYPCPGSIAMIAFFHPSRFCASSGSSWCCLRSLHTLSIHLSLGLPRGLFPPTFIVVTCFATFVSSEVITWPYHERCFWVTYVVIGLTTSQYKTNLQSKISIFIETMGHFKCYVMSGYLTPSTPYIL